MKKILCLLLAALMLSSTVACADPDTPAEETKTETEAEAEIETETETETETAVGTAETAPDETVTETETQVENQTESQADTETEDASLYQCDLPSDLHYGNRPVRVLYAIVTGREDELFVEGSGSGMIEEAVYERNQVVEDQLGITLELIGEIGSNAVSNKLSTDVKGNVGSYDMVVNGTFAAISSVINGYYVDLSSLEHIDTSKHYWTQGYNALSTFTAENRQYLASGSLALSMFRLMFFTIYNQSVLEDRQMEDLYDVVRRGDWTLDYQYSLIAGLYDDSDGDGMRSETDTYGFITGNIISMDPYMVAGGVPLIIRAPEDNSLVFNADAASPLSDLVDAVQKLVNDEGTYVFTGVDRDDVGKENITKAFANGKSLMATLMFWNMEHNIDELSALSYSIAPIPKLTREQEYKSYVQDQVSSFGISATVQKEELREMVAATMEALAYHSYNIIRPAYYTNTLSTKFMQSPKSADILGIIFDSLYFDFSQTCSGIFNGTNLRNSLRPVMSGKSNNIASQAKGWSKNMPKLIKRVNEKLEKLSG